MKTRLNAEMRAEIIRSVMAATNLDDERRVIENETAALAAKLCREAQPPGWFELVKDKPADWFKLDSHVHVQSDLNPLTAFQDTATAYYKSWQIDYPAPIPVAIPYSVTPEQSQVLFGDLRKRAEQWAERNQEMRESLRAFLLSCRTTDQVETRMPELKKHIPKTAQSYPLVAPSNVLAQLARLGFDRTAAA